MSANRKRPPLFLRGAILLFALAAVGTYVVMHQRAAMVSDHHSAADGQGHPAPSITDRENRPSSSALTIDPSHDPRPSGLGTVEFSDEGRHQIKRQYSQEIVVPTLDDLMRDIATHKQPSDAAEKCHLAQPRIWSGSKSGIIDIPRQGDAAKLPPAENNSEAGLQANPRLLTNRGSPMLFYGSKMGPIAIPLYLPKSADEGSHEDEGLQKDAESLKETDAKSPGAEAAPPSAPSSDSVAPNQPVLLPSSKRSAVTIPRRRPASEASEGNKKSENGETTKVDGE